MKKLKFCVIGLSVSVLVIGYGISTTSSVNDNGEIHKTIDTIKGYFETNDNGQTYGTYIDNGDGDLQEPDLIAVVGVDNVEGYVRKIDLYNEKNQPQNLEEAQDYIEKREKDGSRIIPVYKKDGKTVIGEYEVD